MHLSLVSSRPAPVEPAEAPRCLVADPEGPIGTLAWLAKAPIIVGRNIGHHTAQGIVDLLGHETWDELEHSSPFALTTAVAKCLAAGGKVRALPIIAELSPADRAFFMARLADAMGPAARGLERQL